MGERLGNLLPGVYAKPTKHKKYHVFHYSIALRYSLAFFDKFIKFFQRKDKNLLVIYIKPEYRAGRREKWRNFTSILQTGGNGFDGFALCCSRSQLNCNSNL